MTKYVAFKIFDSEDYGKDWYAIRKKQVDKYYTIVHEEYFEGIIKEALKND